MALPDSKSIIAVGAAVNAQEHCQKAMIILTAVPRSEQLAEGMRLRGVFASLMASRSAGIYDVKNARFASYTDDTDADGTHKT